MRRRLLLSVFLVGLCLGASLVFSEAREDSTPAAPTEFDQTLAAASTPAQLESLLKKFPGEGDKIVPKLEDAIIANLAAGAGKKVTIKELKPKALKSSATGGGPGLMQGQPGQTVTFLPNFGPSTKSNAPLERLTIKQDAPADVTFVRYVPDAQGKFRAATSKGSINFSMTTEFPETDRFSGGGVFVTSKQPISRRPTEVVTEDKENRVIGTIIGFDKGSIYRIDGQVNLDNYVFIGEGDHLSRLTFVVHEAGLTYVRGHGRVQLPNGKQLKF